MGQRCCRFLVPTCLRPEQGLVEEINDTKGNIDTISVSLLQVIQTTRPQLQKVNTGCDEARKVLRVPHDVHKDVKDFGRTVKAIKLEARFLAKIPISVIKAFLIPVAELCTVVLTQTKSMLKMTKRADAQARPALKRLDKIQGLVGECDQSLEKLQEVIPQVQDCVGQIAMSVSKNMDSQDAAKENKAGRCCRGSAKHKYTAACKKCVQTVNHALTFVETSCEQIGMFAGQVDSAAKTVNPMIDPARQGMDVAQQLMRPLAKPIKYASETIMENTLVKAGLDLLSTLDSVVQPLFDSLLQPLLAPIRAVLDQCNPMKPQLEELEKSIKDTLMGDLLRHIHETTNALDGIVKLQATFGKRTVEFKATSATVGLDTVLKKGMKRLQQMVRARLKEQLQAAAEAQLETLRGDLRQRCNAEALCETLGISMPKENNKNGDGKGSAQTSKDCLCACLSKNKKNGDGKSEEEEELTEKMVLNMEKKLKNKLKQMYNEAVEKVIADVMNVDNIRAAIEEGAKLAKGKKPLTRKDVKKVGNFYVKQAVAKGKEEIKQEVMAMEKDLRDEAVRLVKAEVQRQNEQLIKALKREAMMMAMEAITKELNTILGEVGESHQSVNWDDTLHTAMDLAAKGIDMLNKKQGTDAEALQAAQVLEEEDEVLDKLLESELDPWP